MTTIDCDNCLVRGLACGDCVVTVLMGSPPQIDLSDDEMTALSALAGGGLIPPLRLAVAREPTPRPMSAEPA